MIFGGLEKFTLIDYPGKIACMVYTIGCNFRCPYCHNPELVDETTTVHISERELYNFLDTRKGMLEGVVITGGEPTMHSDLLAVMQEIKARGFLVKLDTNGTHSHMLGQAIEQGLVDYVAMDIKSPLKHYNRTVASAVDTESIRQSIDLLLSSPVEYEFRTTVVKGLLSPEDISEIGKEIKGAKRYYLQKFVSTKILNPQFIKKTTYSDDEFEAFRKELHNYVDYCSIR
jgi:pyruvate formate lyase activating enzyme